MKSVTLGSWAGEVVGPQHLLNVHCMPNAFLHVSESRRQPLLILELFGLNVTFLGVCILLL